MPTKLKLLLFLFFIAGSANAQQTNPCDTIYLTVLGKPVNIKGGQHIILKEWLYRVKGLYLNSPAYTITSFDFAVSSMCGGGIRNNGALFDKRVLEYIQDAKAPTKLFFDNIQVTGPGGISCNKQFFIEVR